MSDTGAEAQSTPKGRDEQRKLRATYLNNLAVASAIAAALRPTVNLLEGRALHPSDAVAFVILGGLSYVLHRMAVETVRSLEA